MSKTIISACHSKQTATHLIASARANGFDSKSFSLITPDTGGPALDSLQAMVPSIQARVYKKYLRMGDSLLVAQVAEDDVARLIKLLQTRGGQHIEAFDRVSSPSPG